MVPRHVGASFFEKSLRKIWWKEKNAVSLHSLTRTRAFSSAGLEHLPYKQRVGGSNPSTPTIEKIVWFPDSLFLFRNQRVYPRFQKLFQSKLTSLQFPISSATRGQRSDDLTRTYQVLLYTSR